MSKELWRPVDQEMKELADKIHNYAVAIVDRDGIKAWGRLRRGIRTKYHADRKVIDVYVEEDIAPYAQYVHEGRKAGKMPPVGPIEEWVRKKNVIKSEVKLPVRLTSRITSAQQKMADEAHRAAWAIAVSMKKRELKPRRFLVEAIMRALRELPSASGQ
jgi:hypothetical protein